MSLLRFMSVIVRLMKKCRAGLMAWERLSGPEDPRARRPPHRQAHRFWRGLVATLE
jgi:hypothetical protein